MKMVSFTMRKMTKRESESPQEKLGLALHEAYLRVYCTEAPFHDQPAISALRLSSREVFHKIALELINLGVGFVNEKEKK